MKTEKADLIVHNAIIYSLDGTNSVHQAMAVKDGKILELGPEREILNRYGAEKTIDAGKKTIYPGFIDAHCHFFWYSLTLQRLDLSGTSSFDAVLKIVAEAKPTDGNWIVGSGWDQNDWPDKAFPHKEALDALFPETPVLLTRVDGHAALANSSALLAAGIHDTSSVDGGIFERDSDGLTGMLIDNAVGLANDAIPSLTKEQQEKALLNAQERCFAVGLTTVSDAGLDKDEIDLIQELQEAEQLKMRMYAMISDKPENFEHYLSLGPFQTDRLTVRAFKFFADGALGSRGALLLNPYTDAPETSGLLLSPKAHFKSMFQKAHDAGFQVSTHCIGDSANRLILDLMGEILQETNDKRWRIEHAQIVHRDDIDKFSRFSILPSVQPTHATSDMYWAETRLGKKRLTRAYAYQDLKNQLGMLPLGTDFPVEGIDPIRTFYAAVFRQDVDGFPEGGFQMSNALSRKDALLGMTIWAAISNFEEQQKGTLEPGKVADFVILDRDILKVDQAKILDTQVLSTYLNGEEVYSNRP